MKKEDKSTIINQLKDILAEYKHFYIVDSSELDAEKTSQLRRTCFKEDIKLVVVKNTLFQKALEATEGDFSPLFGVLKGSTSIMFSNNANSPAKLIKEFNKDKAYDGKPALKAAYAQDGFYVGAEQLDTLVSIKSKEELIGEIIGLLQSPMQNVLSGLQSGGNTIHGLLKTLGEKPE